MSAVGNYVTMVFKNTVGLLKGMSLTLRYLTDKPVTIQYPEEKAPTYERFRGFLLFHPETCIACSLCVKACPSQCIELVDKKNAAGKKIIDSYAIDFGRCNWCHLCEESCPTKPLSIHHTWEYELIFNSRDDFKVTWRTDADGKALPPVNLAGKPFPLYGKDHPETLKHLAKAAPPAPQTA